MQRWQTARWRLVAAVLVVPAATAALAFALNGSQQQKQRLGARALAAALDSPGAGEPGEVSPAKVEQYWQTRLTYPTGRFSQRWLLEAARQARR